jgi:rhamnulokinase
MREVSPHEIKRLHIIGGGSKNALMNQFAANATGLVVIAGPSEATAIGNCMLQARAAGLAGDRWEMRSLIGRFVETSTFEPTGTAEWEEAYIQYRSILERKQ